MKTLLLLSLVAAGVCPSVTAQQGSTARVFRSADEILNVVPSTIVVREKDLNMAALEQANVVMRRLAVAHPAELRSRIERIEKSKVKNYPPGFVANGPPVKVRRGTDTIAVQVSFFFNQVDAAEAAAIKPGSEITGSGTIRAAEYRVGKRGALTLYIDVTGSKVK